MLAISSRSAFTAVCRSRVNQLPRVLTAFSRTPTPLSLKNKHAVLPPCAKGLSSITPQPSDRNASSQSTLETALSRLQIVRTAFSIVYERAAATPYGRLMRLDKPTGSHLLFLPAAWSITLAASPGDMLAMLPLFYAGAVVLRGAGCTINDIWDADIDRRVARTRDRPIAAGYISTTAGFVFLGAQLLVGLGILTHLNTFSFLVGSASVLPMLFYPLAKRCTAYPQAVLGLTFNWGALLGYSAATGTLAMPALFLYGAGWCWTMVYDTIYAHQDKADDDIVGVQSTALTFGENAKPILAALTAGKLAFLTAAGLSADLSLPYFMGTTASAIHLGHQVYATNLSHPKQCLTAFVSNSTTGSITCAAILAGRIF